MSSVPQYLVFLAGCSQRYAPKWTLYVKSSLCKIAVECLTGNLSSRHSIKIMSQLNRHCLPCHRELSAKQQSCADVGAL
ncbi:hypothetical protein TNCV_4470921 [Trichonephila clavipes]|uniref:Uncharacterized protein n=1 Tax=Trichonephila clavipes TaxID=2585209 RepID=A0A8X6SML0_TRICX|nr:hypothetical protein TNCV_4470921 [Trichonephila clavipes]